MKHLIIYHAHCNDGIGAAWVAWNALKDHAPTELFAAGYGKEPPFNKVDKETQVHIVDFSYSPEQFTKLCELADIVYLLDHHKTAIEAFENYERPVNSRIFFDINHSGARIAWEVYNSGPAPRIIDHIEDRDMWWFKLEFTNEIHLNLNTMEKTVEIFDQIVQRTSLDEGYFDFICEGKAINRYYQQAIQNILNTQKREISINGVMGLACNCPGQFASDVGHHLANESGTFGFTWEQLKDGKAKCSLRSNGNFDVAVMAKSFGGGGHKNAAGFVVDRDVIVAML